ncbi:hypothetical protein [Prosthecobacter fluviatilis]|uniref:Uncharacterized protein n=1 Tax=Prosthecobacter fluviatilis TaxID=445931 RepID=A0ABW0KT74_9BACT
MKHAALVPAFVLVLLSVALVSCRSDPTLSVTSSLPRHGLRGKTLAIGGLTAPGTNIYPGQEEESIILVNAEHELRKHLKHSRVLSMAAVQQAVGHAPAKFSSGVPIILGSKLSPAFMRKARGRGIDCLLWIDLRLNSVDADTRQNTFTRTFRNSCSCGKVNGKSCGGGSCASGCSRSCGSYSTESENVVSKIARRTVGASYSLLDTATGHVVWQAESMLTRGNVRSNRSTTGVPVPPTTPLPPTESAIMLRMTHAALDRLPQ